MFDDLKIVPEMSGFRHDDFYTSHALGTYSVNILRTITEKKKEPLLMFITTALENYHPHLSY